MLTNIDSLKNNLYETFMFISLDTNSVFQIVFYGEIIAVEHDLVYINQIHFKSSPKGAKKVITQTRVLTWGTFKVVRIRR